MDVTAEHARDRWAEISIYDKAPMRHRLSGLGLEYVILEVFSRDAGQRSAIISFNVGQGTQDIGFRNDTEVVFTSLAGASAADRACRTSTAARRPLGS